MCYDLNWNDNPLFFVLYIVLVQFFYELLIKTVFLSALAKYFGTILVNNFISNFQNSFLLWIVFVGAKKSEPFLGLLESKREYSESLSQGEIKSVLLKVYLTCRSFGMVNETVQSFLFQNAYKLSSEFNLTTFYDECENAVKNVVSDLRIRNIIDPESIELNQKYIDLIKEVKPILSRFHNRLSIGSICYYAVIAYGSSVGAVFEKEIYRNCINIANTFCFQNELYSTKLTNEELCLMYIELISLLVSTPSIKILFDDAIKLCLNNSSEQEKIKEVKAFALEFVLTYNIR